MAGIVPDGFIATGFTRIMIRNDSFCCGCEQWFDDEVPRRQDLVRIGDEENGFCDYHPECIEKGLEKGLLYYPKEHDDAN
jgi:hypothetical protein